MQKPSTPKGDGGHTLGDYPNAANIREWMRQYFGTTGPNVDIRFTYWYSRGELPSIDSPAAALHFGLSKGYRLTDAGRAKAYELGVLSDDSPAVPIQPKSIFQRSSSGTASATQIPSEVAAAKFLYSQLKAMQERWAFLTGIQKGWILNYLHGATGKEPETGYIGASNIGIVQCLRTREVIIAVEHETLAKDFGEVDLLRWANDTGKTLTAEGLAAWERLNSTKQANTRTAKEPGLAAAIGANGWADIRLVVRTGGVTFHGPGGLRPLTWEKMGLGEENAKAQTALLILLAKAGGHLPHSERAESKPDTGGNRATWTAKEWEREAERATIRKFSERAAGENEQTKIRANVKRLNKKFMTLFPSIQGRPIENRKGVTISNFKRIEFQ